MSQIKEIPFPAVAFLDLRDSELKLIDQSLLERKWRIESLAKKKNATTEQLIELHHLKKVIEKLFRLRFSNYYNSMSKYHEHKANPKPSHPARQPITPKGYR